MSESTEMILDGTVCMNCLTLFDDVAEGEVPPGHPRSCGCIEELEPVCDDSPDLTLCENIK